MWRGIHLPSNPPETRKLLNALSMLSDDQAEMLAHEIVVSTKIDVWSWGYCMLCLLTGKDEVGPLARLTIEVALLAPIPEENMITSTYAITVTQAEVDLPLPCLQCYS
jgi:hypothetical protein